MLRISTDNDTLLISEEHNIKASIIHKMITNNRKRKVLAIGGLSGCGKSEIAYQLRELLGKDCIILHLDDYYRSHPDERDNFRITMGHVGIKEIQWYNVNHISNSFILDSYIILRKYNKYIHDYIDQIIPIPETCTLIIEGLFALNTLHCDYYFHIDSTYSTTKEFRKLRNKEKLTEWREKILEMESRDVEYLLREQKEAIII